MWIKTILICCSNHGLPYFKTQGINAKRISQLADLVAIQTMKTLSLAGAKWY